MRHEFATECTATTRCYPIPGRIRLWGSRSHESLKRRALTHQLSGASRTFVVTDQEGGVYGDYAMAAGAVSHQAATSSMRRNMSDPILVMVLARLAVDHRAQGIKLGASLLRDAVGHAVRVSQNAGVRALLVHPNAIARALF